MTAEELHAVKSELQQLGVELKEFKEELLTARAEELEQIVHAPARRARLGFYGNDREQMSWRFRWNWR